MIDFQLPRVLLCWLVGTALAVSGAVMQGVIRNPLAAPDIIGVTKGAGFAGMLLLLAIPGLPVVAVVPAAFVGGLAAAGSCTCSPIAAEPRRCGSRWSASRSVRRSRRASGSCWCATRST